MLTQELATMRSAGENPSGCANRWRSIHFRPDSVGLNGSRCGPYQPTSPATRWHTRSFGGTRNGEILSDERVMLETGRHDET